MRTQYHFWPGDEGRDAWAVDRLVELARDLPVEDPSDPIILGADGRVMDGMHRIARALLEGRATISAVRLDPNPEPDFRNCRPEDLAY